MPVSGYLKSSMLSRPMTSGLQLEGRGTTTQNTVPVQYCTKMIRPALFLQKQYCDHFRNCNIILRQQMLFENSKSRPFLKMQKGLLRHTDLENDK